MTCHFGVIFVSFLCHFGVKMAPVTSPTFRWLKNDMSFWCHFGVILVSFWCRNGASDTIDLPGTQKCHVILVTQKGRVIWVSFLRRQWSRPVKLTCHTLRHRLAAGIRNTKAMQPLNANSIKLKLNAMVTSGISCVCYHVVNEQYFGLIKAPRVAPNSFVR